MRTIALGALLASVAAGPACSRAPETVDHPEQPAPEPADHRFCGWLYASGDPALKDLSYDTFAAHADAFDAVHPVWWHVSAPTAFERRPRGFDDPRVLSHTTRGGARTKLVPTIEAVDRPDLEFVHVMLHDAALRAEHIRGVARIVAEQRYDGVDLDYEHLSTALAPGETIDGERRAFSSFIADLSSVLHAMGKSISIAVPVVTPGTEDAYDYDALSASVDQVHIMGYDYHWEQGPHAGPVAPLGWIRNVVKDISSVAAGRKDRFILGFPNYGLVGPEAKLCTPTSKCLDLVRGAYRVETGHMHHCSMGAEEPGRAPNGRQADGKEVYFDDLASLEEKIEVAERAGLGGVAYWSIGGEPDRPGREGFFSMVRRHFPVRK
jgi:spore germination protein YaaH